MKSGNDNDVERPTEDCLALDLSFMGVNINQTPAANGLWDEYRKRIARKLLREYDIRCKPMEDF